MNYSIPPSEEDKERWAMHALKRALYRSRKFGFQFNIELLDIPTPDCCPAFGTLLDYANASRGRGRGMLDEQGNRRHGLSMASPCLARRDHAKGYVRGNVWTICMRANACQGSLLASDFLELIELGWWSTPGEWSREVGLAELRRRRG